MRRFVVIATMRRGPVRPSEPVSEDAELRLNESMRLEVFADRVKWAQGFDVMSERAVVDRMMRAARRAR